MLTILQATTSWWEPILTPILATLGTAIAGLLGALIFKLTSWVNRKIGNEKVANAVDRVAFIIDAAVKNINQAFVDQLKKDGKFDKEAQEEAMREAFNLSFNMISEETKDVITEAFGDIHKYFRTMIEEAVSRNK